MIGEEITATTAMTVTFGKSASESLVMTDSEPLGRRFSYPSISESIVAADDPTFAFSFTLTDIIFIYDVLIHGWKETTTESLVLTDSLAEVLGVMISDWITMVDSQSTSWNGREIVNQSLNLYDIASQIQTFANTINEDLTIADAPTWVLALAILEWMGFADLATAARTIYPSVSESVVLTDEALNAWQEIINDTLQAVDASSAFNAWREIINDTLQAVDASSAFNALRKIINDTLQAVDASSAFNAWREIINDILQAVDASSVIATFINVVQESLAPADTVSLINRLGLSLNDSLILTETITSKGTLYNVIYDTIAMNMTVELAGEVYECYVLNTPKFHPSMYSGFNFNSYCVFDNRAFGANGAGIYELTGTTDAGSTIHTGMISSQTDFGLRNEKRFRRGYIGVSGASPVMILECEDGSRKVYTIDTKGKAVFSHEQKSKEWKLAAADFDTLDVIKLIPVILSK